MEYRFEHLPDGTMRSVPRKKGSLLVWLAVIFVVLFGALAVTSLGNDSGSGEGCDISATFSC